MNEAKTEWRDCADPDELAAAVAAGIEVQMHVGSAGGEPWVPVPLANRNSEAFRLGVEHIGFRFRVPADWSPTPEPPADDPRERIVERLRRAVATTENGGGEWHQLLHRCREAADFIAALPASPAPPWPGDENDDIARLSPDQGDRIVHACCRILGCEPADIDGDAAYEEILTEAVERCADLHGQDRWEDDCHGCGFRVGDHTTDGRCPTPSPVPPWPGAVLSGLTDEDGEPTWLAQAGHVRGEQVRACASVPWLPNTSYGEDEWVEVRAPRAVPATERVPVLDAITHRRQVTHPSAPFEAEAVMWVEGELAVCEYGGPAQPVAPDGTVEVLKDGDR